MAVEAKRGCGYRKVGGLYLVGGGIGVPCDRLPLILEICPCCGQGIKQGMGWTWVDVAKLVQGKHKISTQDGFAEAVESCDEAEKCVFCGNPESMGRAGLLWVGEKFYKTPDDFVKEGVSLGFSKRIGAVPHGFKIGETYILLAHPKAVGSYAAAGEEGVKDLIPGVTLKFKPGIFYIWLPQRIEKILPESERENEAEMESLDSRNITPVFVPDEDPDHRGRVYDKKEDIDEIR